MRCCCLRPRSVRSPRCSRRPTSTGSRTGRSTRPPSRLYGKGEPVDAITLANELDERSELERVGGTAKIAELAAVVPATSNAEHYARIVKEMATLRGLVRVGQEIQRLGQTRPGETTDLVDRAEQMVFDLAQQRVTGDFAHIHDLLNESFARIMHLYEAGVDVTGVPSGFRELDKLTSGFQPGNLVIIAARPSMGKSALALCTAANLGVRHETPVALFTLEMSKVGGDPAADVQRGQGRVAASAIGAARPGRLAAAHGRLRQADEGADLRRRHRLDHDDGAALEGPASQVARAEARHDHRRLPPADDVWLEPGEPRAGGLADLAAAEGARARPRGADHRALPALAGRRAASGQASDPLRPPRVAARSSRMPTSSPSSTATSTTTARSPTRRASPR